jgi:septal ring factor EnvC (AmiA/AmiB activator)
MTSRLQDAVSATDVMSPGAVPGSRVRGKNATATPAGQSLDRAQHALSQAAQTEQQLRTSLKEHSKAVSAAKDDLSRYDRDLKVMKSQLKTAKKSRKRAAKKLRQMSKPAAVQA